MMIDLYADVACPWCYIGERRLRRALIHRPDIPTEIRWRPFQLEPHMSRSGENWSDYAVRHYGGPESMRRTIEQLRRIGATEEIEFDFDRISTVPNTLDAHRLILYAARHDREWTLADALFSAHFAQGRNLSDTDQLIDIARSAGLDPDNARRCIIGTDNVAEVHDSQQTAGELGITGVPAFVIDGRWLISGAVEPEVFHNVFDRAMEAVES